jgi:hypothetical protein
MTVFVRISVPCFYAPIKVAAAAVVVQFLNPSPDNLALFIVQHLEDEVTRLEVTAVCNFCCVY